MKTFTYVIKDKQGIHARPAGVLVAEAKKYNCQLTISNKGKTSDLKRIFGVMCLCVKCGEEIVISASGEDEDNAIANIQSVLEKNL